MNQLETTIVECAEEELVTLLNPPPEWDFTSRLDYTGAYQAAMAYCKLAHIADSGLAEACTAKLLAIEEQATAAFVKSDVMK